MDATNFGVKHILLYWILQLELYRLGCLPPFSLKYHKFSSSSRIVASPDFLVPAHYVLMHDVFSLKQNLLALHGHIFPLILTLISFFFLYYLMCFWYSLLPLFLICRILLLIFGRCCTKQCIL